MQVEYEEEPAASPRSAAKVPPAAAEDKSEDEEEQDEEEPMQVEGDEPKQKKKRIIKQRQSLAEKERGTTIFPTARIKKIIKADKELEMMTAEAVFMIAVTTEYFIKHFMEEGWTRAQMDKRKIVNYKDMAAVVARSPDFDFLKDVIPAPMPMSEALERRRQKIAAEGNPTEEDDSELPPIGETVIPSTNPLYPNAIVKKPPNTHSKAPGKAKMAAAAAAAAAESAADESVSENDEERKKAAPLPLPSTPKVLTGKNAPTTPHGLTTRGSARRSLASTEVNHDAVEDIRAEADEAANDDNAVSEKMDED